MTERGARITTAGYRKDDRPDRGGYTELSPTTVQVVFGRTEVEVLLSGGGRRRIDAHVGKLATGVSMRKLVDRNFLQSPQFREYLLVSRKNFAVLTDYAAMEAFKGDTLANISSAMEILSEFPKQVIILKNTSIICQLKGRRCGFTRRMIDKKQTEGFCRLV
jgi:hypothetical protein